MRFRIWSEPSSLDQTDYARDIGPKILKFFEDYFSVPYPLPKQDMIAIPDFAAGAMENWGLITYRETALLYKEGVSAASNRQRIAIVVSHELAHQVRSCFSFWHNHVDFCALVVWKSGYSVMVD